MADRNTPPVFLDHRSYRKRRVMDAVRMVPVLGALLWMVPLLWSDGPSVDATPTSLSEAIKYVFWVWFGLIVVSAFLWGITKDRASSEGAKESDT